MKWAWLCVVAALGVATVATVATSAGCEGRKPVFDCGRPGTNCGETPGATCVEDRCAVPSSDCPSGLIWDVSAGELAGMCTPPGGGGIDGGLDCGNGVLDLGEACDGAELGDKTCVGEGFAGGTLACNACALDTSACTTPPGCGDTLIGPTEDCDGANLAGHDCMSRGFHAGTLACNGACKFDLSMCTNCGNATKNDGEACDGADLGGNSCADVGTFEQGTLGCTAACAFDTAACIHCGDGAAQGSETCDGADLKMKDCALLGFMGGTLGCNAASCTYDTSACVPFPNCPDGDIDSGEQCDGVQLGGGTCSSATGGLRPTGTLKCSAGCQYDTGGCYKCGDGVLHGAEVCDTTNFGADSCVGRGHDGGALTCAGTCLTVSDTSCTDCGDGTKEGAETCDGTQLGGATCQSVGSFSGGALACNGTCNGFATAMCLGPPTTPKPRLPMNNSYVGTIHTAGTRRPTFKWEASTAPAGADPIRYELQYSTDKTFSAALTTTVMNGQLTSFQPAADLAVALTAPVGARYYWRVRACAGSACSAYGMTWWVNVGRDGSDFNGDGFADLGVGDFGSSAGGTASGLVVLYAGAAGSAFAFTSPMVSFPGNANDSCNTVRFAGDFNADGFADLIVGCTPGGTGQTRLHFGSSAPDTTVDWARTGTCLAAGDVNGDGFDDLVCGLAVLLGGAMPNTSPDGSLITVATLGTARGVGDVNGDGFADVLYASNVYSADADFMFEGMAELFFGAAGSAFDGVSDWSRIGASGEGFGRTFGGGQDLNRDGFGDFCVAAAGSGKVFFGAPAGPIAAGEVATATADSVVLADVDSNGTADLVIGIGSQGKVFVYLGQVGASFDTTPDQTITGIVADGFGGRVGLAGDSSGDGFPDVAVGASAHDPAGLMNAGAAYVYFGGTTPFSSGIRGTLLGTRVNQNLGSSMSGP